MIEKEVSILGYISLERFDLGGGGSSTIASSVMNN